MPRKALAVAALAAMLAPAAEAKTWTETAKYYDSIFTCEDERQVGGRLGAAPLNKIDTAEFGTGTRTTPSLGHVHCIQVCLSNAKCRTVNIRHITSLVPPSDNYTCTLYSNATTARIVYKTVAGPPGRWGAVCSRAFKKKTVPLPGS